MPRHQYIFISSTSKGPMLSIAILWFSSRTDTENFAPWDPVPSFRSCWHTWQTPHQSAYQTKFTSFPESRKVSLKPKWSPVLLCPDSISALWSRHWRLWYKYVNYTRTQLNNLRETKSVFSTITTVLQPYYPHLGYNLRSNHILIRKFSIVQFSGTCKFLWSERTKNLLP